MGRLKTTNKKRINTECIFCGSNNRKQKIIKTGIIEIEYIFIPPLDNQFHPVCKKCLPVLENYKQKYPHLWE